MKAIIKNIEVDDVDEGAPSGQVTLEVNGKEVVVIIHECGELDFEGPELTDVESKLMWDTLNESKEVQAAFPPDMY